MAASTLAGELIVASPVIHTEAIQRLIAEGNEEQAVPLNSNWSFWYEKSVAGMSTSNFENNIKKIYSVETVEGFWSVYNNIPEPSMLACRYSYHLMREERKPMWEEPAHARGGSWKFKCHKADSNVVWKELLLAAIGETLSDSLAKGDEVSGISITVREHDDVIQIWNVNAQLANRSTLETDITNLLPEVRFITCFYKAFEAHSDYKGKR